MPITGDFPSGHETIRLRAFVELSRCITAVSELDMNLAHNHLAHLSSDPKVRTDLDELLTVWMSAQGSPDEEEALRRALNGSPLAQVAAVVLVLWYTGGLLVEGKLDYPEDDPEPYFGALLWEAIGAHPPGQSGGYFGHWRYTPDNS